MTTGMMIRQKAKAVMKVVSLLVLFKGLTGNEQQLSLLWRNVLTSKKMEQVFIPSGPMAVRRWANNTPFLLKVRHYLHKTRHEMLAAKAQMSLHNAWFILTVSEATKKCAQARKSQLWSFQNIWTIVFFHHVMLSVTWISLIALYRIWQHFVLHVLSDVWLSSGVQYMYVCLYTPAERRSQSVLKMEVSDRFGAKRTVRR